MEKRIIFHHPLPIVPDGVSGSSIRPHYMLEGFRREGFLVDVVAGYASERRRAAKRVADLLARGKRYNFCYSEASTMPTLLTERHHIPLHPRLDFGFFATLARYRIPIGLFYRDVYWRFNHLHRHTASWKRLISKLAYQYDWKKYGQLVDHLFVPSQRMIRELPGVWPPHSVSALPPGCDIQPSTDWHSDAKSDYLNLFYVGGVLPPLYDLTPMFRICESVNGIRLTVCCRANEWRAAKALYEPISEQIKIIHAQGSELSLYYQQADAFAMFRSADPYLDWAAPVKLFEAFGHGLPVITNSNTEAARIVKQEDAGWVLSSEDEFRSLLEYLAKHRNVLHSKRLQLIEIRDRHTWGARVRQVETTLSKYRR